MTALLDFQLQGSPETLLGWTWLTPWIVVFGEVIAVFFVIHVIQSGRHPGATIAWIIVILAAPYIGLALYYLLGRRIHLKRLRLRIISRSDVGGALPEIGPGGGVVVEDDPLLRLLENLDPESVHQGNSLELLGSGQEFGERARAAIESATSSVHLEVYILRPDATGRRMLEILADKARSGVEVRVLYDSVGSWALREDHLAGLHAAGGCSAAFLPLLWRHRPFTINMRNHRKILVIDGRIAFVGGRNVGDEYLQDRFGATHRWLDCMVRIEGPVVRRLQRTFVEDWHTASEEALSDATYFPERSIGGDQVAVGGDGIAVGGDGIAVGGDGIAVGGDGIAVGSDGIAVGSDQVAVGSDAIAVGGDQTVAVVEGGPDIEHNALHWMFLQLLMSARHSIRISSPYLIPHVSLLAALQVAAARGVDVRIQTNGPAAENTLLYWAKRSFYRSLLGSNVHIAETVGDYNHSKIIIVDDRYTFVGSPNLDVRSDELNFEIGVVMLGPDICRQATELFEARIESGRTIDLDSVRTDWRARLMYGLGRLISPVL